MNKKLLIVTLIIAIAVVGALVLTGCQKTTFTFNIELPTDDAWLRLAPDSESLMGDIKEGTTLSYEFEIADYMDASTLKMYVNGVETPITLDPGYAETATMSGAYIPVLNYTLDGLSADTNITFSCDYRPVNITFSTDVDPATLTDDQRTIMGNLSFKEDTNLSSIYTTPLTITTTYRALYNDSFELPLRYAYPDAALNILVDSAFCQGYSIYYKGQQDYLAQYKLCLATDNNVVSPSNSVVLDPTKLSYNCFTIVLGSPVFSVVGATPVGDHYEIVSKPTDRFGIVFDTTTPGVDYSVARIRINEKLYTFDPNEIFYINLTSSPTYFNEYYEDTGVVTSTLYDIDIDSLTFDANEFYKLRAKSITGVSYENIDILTVKPYYVTPNGVNYYKKGDVGNNGLTFSTIATADNPLTKVIVEVGGTYIEKTFASIKDDPASTTSTQNSYTLYTLSQDGITYVVTYDGATFAKISVTIPVGNTYYVDFEV